MSMSFSGPEVQYGHQPLSITMCKGEERFSILPDTLGKDVPEKFIDTSVEKVQEYCKNFFATRLKNEMDSVDRSQLIRCEAAGMLQLFKQKLPELAERGANYFAEIFYGKKSKKNHLEALGMLQSRLLTLEAEGNRAIVQSGAGRHRSSYRGQRARDRLAGNLTKRQLKKEVLTYKKSVCFKGFDDALSLTKLIFAEISNKKILSLKSDRKGADVHFQVSAETLREFQGESSNSIITLHAKTQADEAYASLLGELDAEQPVKAKGAAGKASKKRKGKKRKSKRLGGVEKTAKEARNSEPFPAPSASTSSGRGVYVLQKRVARWSKSLPEIKLFKDRVDGSIVYHYRELSTDQLTWQKACHHLPGIEELVDEEKPRYAFPTERGFGFFAKLKLAHEELPHEGMVYLGVRDRQIYHAMFEERDFSSLSKDVSTILTNRTPEQPNESESGSGSDDDTEQKTPVSDEAWQLVGKKAMKVDERGVVTIDYPDENGEVTRSLQVYPIT